LQVVQGAGVHGLGVEAETVALLFGPVHRGIGILQQGVNVLAVRGRDANPDAGGDGHLVAFDDERRGVHRFQQALRGDRRLGLPADVGQQEGELVAAEPGHQRVVGQTAGEPLRDLLQQPVARAMPQRVVDLFEVVQVQKKDADH
jgi:hypothetical protein